MESTSIKPPNTANSTNSSGESVSALVLLGVYRRGKKQIATRGEA